MTLIAVSVCRYAVANFSAAGVASSISHDKLLLERPLVIAHRGSSGVLPENTVEAFQRAISDGADVIECDVTLSRDLVPVCLHEELLQVTTDVANRSEFTDRRRSISLGPVRVIILNA